MNESHTSVRQKILRELENSAIAPAFVAQAEIVPALEFDPISKEVLGTPLDDALNWRYIRFPHEIKNPGEEWGIVFRNEDGSEWQVKRGFGLSEPLGKGKGYYAPKGVGNAIYTPAIPREILGKICTRHGLKLHKALTKIEECGGFWAWVLSRKDLPICITEGAKKSLAALSQGYIAISLYGCTCGRSKALRPFLAERTVIAAFDSDTKQSARKAVASGLYNLAGSVAKQSGSLIVASWDASAGKGIDDLIHQSGPAAFERAIASAVPFELWAARRAVAHPLGSYKPHLRVNVADLSKAIAPESIPSEGTVAFSSGCGTGKTKLITQLIQDVGAVIAPGHRISLQRGLARRLGLTYVADADRHRGYIIDENGQETRRTSLCWDSILSLPKWLYPDGTYDVVLDEADQGLRHLINGGTCGKDGRRPELLARAATFIQGARRIIIASATLGREELNLLASMRGEEPWILQNDHTAKAYPVRLFSGRRGEKGSCARARNAVLHELQHAIEGGQRAIVACDQIFTTKMLASLAETWGLNPNQIFIFNKETSSEDEQRAFADDPDKFLAERDIRLFLFSPSLTSGLSIERFAFDTCFGIFEGQTISPDDALQALGRYRHPVERVIYASHYGRSDGKNDARRLKDFQAAEERRVQMFQAVTQRDADIRASDDPISLYHAATQAKRNATMANFASSLQARLEASGHQVERTEAPQAKSEAMRQAWRAARQTVAAADRQAILSAQILSIAEADELRGKRTLKHADALKLARYDLCDFYRITPPSLTDTDIKTDKRGRWRKSISRLEGILYDRLAHEKDSARMETLQHWNQPISAHDLPGAELCSEAAIALGVRDLLQNCIDNPGWNAETEWVKAFAAKARACAKDIKLAIGFNVHAKMSDCQIVGMVLKYFGLSTQSKQQMIVGKRQRLYALDSDSLDRLKQILEARSERIVEKGFQPCAHPLIRTLLGVCVQPKPPPDPLQVEGYSLVLETAWRMGAAAARATWSEICKMSDRATQQAIQALAPPQIWLDMAKEPG